MRQGGNGDGSCTTFDIEQIIGGVDTGSVLWSGSVVLATLLHRHAVEWGLRAGSSVIELGAGLGLVSIVASCLGASVAATDGDSAILPMLSRNVLLNLDGGCGAVDVQQLRWGNATAARELGTFDFVIGADLVYGSDSVQGNDARESSFAELLCTMWLLSHENTLLVLAYTERKAIESRFFQLLWVHFEGAQLPSAVVSGVPESAKVQLFTFRPRARAEVLGGTSSATASGEQQPPYCVT